MRYPREDACRAWLTHGFLTPAEFAALDEELFSLPFVADYRAERRNGRLHLQILTCGEGALPALDAETEVRPARPEDRSLYAGKRKVEEP